MEVSGGTAPLVETTTNAIGSTIDMKQIEDLPIQGRDLAQLSQLIPGYTGGQNNIGGTWNGLPSIDQGNNIDGIVGSSSRMKFGGNSEPAVSPRLESIEEMTVQTEQLDMNQGFGQASMQVNFVTRRGSNAFHGRVFEDFRNAALNANSWTQRCADRHRPLQSTNEESGQAERLRRQHRRSDHQEQALLLRHVCRAEAAGYGGGQQLAIYICSPIREYSPTRTRMVLTQTVESVSACAEPRCAQQQISAVNGCSIQRLSWVGIGLDRRRSAET